MNINNLVIPENEDLNIDASIDVTKKRVEIKVGGYDDQIIVAYYPTEGLQVYVYKVDGSHIPDMWSLGMRRRISGKYFRALVCKHGYGEFMHEGTSQNLFGGEFAMICGRKDKSNFLLETDCLIAVEMVLQVGRASEESALLKMLKNALQYLGLSEDDFNNGDCSFSGFSKESEKVLDRLIENCINGADSALVLINAAELGYNIGKDFKVIGPKVRTYTTNVQKAIAEDMHTQLTQNYGERITASMFADKYALSDTTVKNYFKNTYGYSFKEYQIKVRMEKGAMMLETTDDKLIEIAMAVGYATQAKFIDAFKKYFNMTPSEYRRLKRLGHVLDTN